MYIFRSATERNFLDSNLGLSRHMTSPVWRRRRSFLRRSVVPLMSVPLPEVSSTNTSMSGGDDDDGGDIDNKEDGEDNDPKRLLLE